MPLVYGFFDNVGFRRIVDASRIGKWEENIEALYIICMAKNEKRE